MNKLTSFTKVPNKPYQNEALNAAYEMLFCDNLGLYRFPAQGLNYPWDSLLADDFKEEALQAISNDQSLESRQQLLACNLLLANGVKPTRKELLGVIVEVALPGGLDVVAAFTDGTARYLNHAEKILIWETTTTDSSVIINKLFNESENLVKQIGPWNEDRRPFPVNGNVRLTFLVSDGLYFGEAPFEVLHADPMAGSVINATLALMTFLIDKGLSTEKV
ncbi:hypothetical protein BH11BAC3_BH11BAC3_27310 [soil metagenome]